MLGTFLAAGAMVVRGVAQAAELLAGAVHDAADGVVMRRVYPEDAADESGPHPDIEDADGWTWVHVPSGFADEALAWLNDEYDGGGW